MYREDQYLEILNLTKEEEEFYRESVDEDNPLDDFEAVSEICIKRGVQTGQYDPVYFVDRFDKVYVFDEKHQDEPLIIL